MIAFLLLRNKRKRHEDCPGYEDYLTEEGGEEDYDAEPGLLDEVGGPGLGIARGWAGGGLLGKVLAAVVAIVVMGLNAFFAAIATQVYKIFTGRWKNGGGSDIPVINTVPGGSSSLGGGSTASAASSSGGASADFLNRYRD
jgi:hypothetical protein